MPFISKAYQGSISAEKRAHLHRTQLLLGHQPETGDDLFLPDTDRYAGTYVLGVQGVGKSTLLESLIAFDHQANNAVIVLDPHSDLITHCLAELPPHRLAQTYILDMEDTAFPFGLNPFHAGKLDNDIARTQAVERIMHIFETLWPDVLSQQGLPRYLRAATITLLANPGSTLVDTYRFLLDKPTRDGMLQSVTDATVREFWQVQYDDLSASERLRRVQPLIGRLESLFMGRSLVRNIVGQRRTTINFRQAIENHEVILIRLPIKTVGHDARLIGTMLMSQIHAAVFSFATVPESKRPGISLYVDEFQEFSTPDIDELFTQGRKFGVKLTVAHQYRGQLPSYLQSSTMTARTKICFQTTPEDGRELAHVFPAQEEGMKPEDIEVHATQHLLDYGADDPVTQVFIETYLRPLQGQKHSGKVQINGAHLTFDLWSGTKLQEIVVADPTPYLDNLLYQVMKTGNGELRIPPEVVVGFSNCGRGFFNQARHLPARDRVLGIETQFPPALVVRTADGGVRWTRLPDTGMEQLFHFIFHLRLAMFALAAHPLGKKTALNSTAVGHMLTQLPRRAAFVRSGETVGVIYTEETPPRITDRELLTRAQTVLDQTRTKYAHPRAEVEQALAQPHLPNQQGSAGPQTNNTPHHAVPSSGTVPASRWEEV